MIDQQSKEVIPQQVFKTDWRIIFEQQHNLGSTSVCNINDRLYFNTLISNAYFYSNRPNLEICTVDAVPDQRLIINGFRGGDHVLVRELENILLGTFGTV